MSKIKCQLKFYFKSRHISQVISGFLMLKRDSIIDLEINYLPLKKYTPFTELVEVSVNDSIKIVYDMCDGYNFNKELVDEYLNGIDFYFKRSFDKEENKGFKNSSCIYPYGFNYHVTVENNIIDNVSLKEFLINPNFAIKKIAKKIMGFNSDFNVEKFEDKPKIPNEKTVLFLTRAWSPFGEKNEFKSKVPQSLSEEREYLNNFRAESIRQLKRELGEQFLGGFAPSEYAYKNYSDCIVKEDITKRSFFMDRVKNSSVCIASMGLHKSNGWKLGEYIAASKGIVSEQLYYSVPGRFEKEKNYLEFNNELECVEQTLKLVTNDQLLYDMQVQNYTYYHNFLRPNRLILNSLYTVLREQTN